MMKDAMAITMTLLKFKRNSNDAIVEILNSFSTIQKDIFADVSDEQQ
jgi:hypothetical protein